MDIKEYVVNQDTKAINHPWESARIKVIYKLLNKFIPHSIPSEILDIGCGDAYVIKELSKKLTNTNFIGVDKALNDELIYKIRDNIKNPRIKLYKDYSNFKSEKFKADIILLLDIIEHIEDDHSFLRSIKQSTFVSKETLFVITVPAFQSLFINRDKWLGHYRRYTDKNLRKVAMVNNMEILESGYFFLSLLPLRLLNKFLEKNKNDQYNSSYQGLNNWTGSKFLAFMLKQILISDFYFTSFFNNIGIKLPGLSCYMICKKR